MPRPDRGAVVVVVIDEKTDQFALVPDHNKHYWKFPGGVIQAVDVDPARPSDDDLTAINAARRETRKETGLTVELLPLCRVAKTTHTLHAFLGLAHFGELVTSMGEEERARAVSLRQIADLCGASKFLPAHKYYLDVALKSLKSR